MIISKILSVTHNEEYSFVTVFLEGLSGSLELSVVTEIKEGMSVRLDWDNKRLVYGDKTYEYWDII